MAYSKECQKKQLKLEKHVLRLQRWQCIAHTLAQPLDIPIILTGLDGPKRM